MKLHSVDLRVPDVDATARFFVEVWGLSRASAHSSQICLRGTDEQGPPAIRAITFCGVVEREVRGPEGETYRFVREQDVAPLAPHRDRPIRLSHVVLNAKDVDASERFATEKPGLKHTAADTGAATLIQ